MLNFDTLLIDGQKINSLWFGETIWNKSGVNGIVLLDNNMWAAVDDGQGRNNISFSAGYTKEYLIERDYDWSIAFDKIDNGLVPDYKRNSKRNIKSNCSCGAHAVFGKEFNSHGFNCLVTNPNANNIKNNDGRKHCYMCSEPVCHVANYQLCKNKKCSWFER